jgi:hypothetical protein
MLFIGILLITSVSCIVIDSITNSFLNIIFQKTENNSINYQLHFGFSIVFATNKEIRQQCQQLVDKENNEKIQKADID